MWKTVLALLVTLAVIPLLAFLMDEPPTEIQKHVLRNLISVYVIAASFCFIVSTLTRNHSQVDKLWSLMPIVYVWLVALSSELEPRLVLMASLVTVWGIRLSYNFSRRGGYSWNVLTGEEDYRWAVLRAKPEFSATWRWVLFNLLFISFYQMGLILLMTLPAVRSMNGSPLGWADYLLAFLMLALIVIETIADQQQWDYHKTKRKLNEAGGELPETYRKGFVHKGLWGLARHPNYAAEQAIWIVFYFFSVAATGNWLNWSVMGAILLVLLFWGSSNFSESISAGKYTDYPDYIKRIPRFLPFTKLSKD